MIFQVRITIAPAADLLWCREEEWVGRLYTLVMIPHSLCECSSQIEDFILFIAADFKPDARANSKLCAAAIQLCSCLKLGQLYFGCLYSLQCCFF